MVFGKSETTSKISQNGIQEATLIYFFKLETHFNKKNI